MSSLRTFLRHSTLLVAAGMAVNALNYAFHLLTARLLPPLAYGEFSAQLSWLFLLLGPAMALQTAITKSGTIPLRSFALWLLVIAGVSALFLPLWIPLCFLLGTSLAATRGLWQHHHQFGLVSAHLLAESLLKLVVFLGLFFLAFPSAAQYSLPVGMGLTMLFFLVPTVRAHPQSTSMAPSQWWKNVAPVALSLTVLVGFFTLDLVVLHHFAPSSTALYSVVGKVGQLLFFAAHLVTTVYFAHATKGNNYLSSTLLLILGTGLLGSLVLWFIGPWVLTFLFGPQYTDGASILWLYTLGITALSLINTLTHHTLTTTPWRTLLPLGTIALVFGAGLFAISSITPSLWAFTATFTSILWLGAIILWFTSRSRNKTQKNNTKN